MLAAAISVALAAGFGLLPAAPFLAAGPFFGDDVDAELGDELAGDALYG